MKISSRANKDHAFDPLYGSLMCIIQDIFIGHRQVVLAEAGKPPIDEVQLLARSIEYRDRSPASYRVVPIPIEALVKA